MDFDPTQFLNGIKAAADKIERAAERAVGEFAEQVLADSQELVPVSPTNPSLPQYIGTSGFLRDSGIVGDVKSTGDTIEVPIGYNANYAATVHERMDQNHQYPGAVNPKAQAKYLETPLRQRKKDFAPYVGNRIREVLGG